MADKKMKRIVAHPKLYMSVDGKLEHIPKGTEVTVTKAQCGSLGKKLMDPEEAKKLKDGKLTKGTETESEAIEELTAKLEAAQKEATEAKAETVKATKALTTTATKLNAAKEKVKVLETAAKK